MREVELKLAVHGSFVMPSLVDDDTGVAAMEQLADLDMKTTYHDSEDLRLARYGITLRHRSGEEGGPRWTIKLPVAGQDATTHDEIHLKGSAAKVPGRARDLLTAFLRSATTVPMASVRTRRHRWSLRDQDDSEMCEVTDDEVSVLEGSKIVSRFREIEIEGRSSGRDLLERVSDTLKAAGAMAAEPIPKSVRAMGARATAAPDVPVEHVVDEGDPAIEAVRGALIRGTRRVIEHDPAVRIGEDVEAVHQMRVGTRRLRSDLRTFAPLLDGEWADRLIDDLRWLAGALGPVRDAEVQLEHFRAVAADLDGDVAPLMDDLERRHRDARDDLMSALRSDHYRSVLDDLVGAIHDPQATEVAGKSCADILPGLVAPAWAKLKKRGRKLGVDSDDGRYHEVRIHAKRTRYAAEAVAPALGGVGEDAAAFAKRCAKLQDALGELQDAVVATASIERVARAHPSDGALGLALGRLIEREGRRRSGARAAFPKLWDALDRKRNVRWLQA